MMAKVKESYELMYIIDLDKGEEEIAAIVEKFKALIEANGTLDELEEWGKRKLAYLINDKPEGYYVLAKFTSAPDFPAELDRILKITDGVMRACHKRAVSVQQMNDLVNQVEIEIFNREDKEIRSSEIGEMVMNHLKELDQVAYVRFASVYREFKDANTFMDELKKLLQ